MKKFNVRILSITAIVGILFIYAFEKLSWIYDYEMAVAYLERGEEIFSEFSSTRITYGLLAIQLFWFLGLVISVIISSVIAIKRGLGIINVVIAFSIVYILQRFGLLDVSFLKKALGYPSQLISDSIIISSSITAVILITISIVLLFSKWNRIRISD